MGSQNDDKGEIVAGSVVTLRSGMGPVLTVESVDRSAANCAWFHEGSLVRAQIALAALKVDTPRLR